MTRNTRDRESGVLMSGRALSIMIKNLVAKGPASTGNFENMVWAGVLERFPGVSLGMRHRSQMLLRGVKFRGACSLLISWLTNGARSPYGVVS